ncbi:MAG: ABC transporter substrate-binding protein [Bacillota bacterium]
MNRISFSTLAVFLGGLLLLGMAFLGYWSLHQEKEPAKVYTLRVVEPKRSLAYLPQYIALEKKFFEEQNLNVELITVSSPEAALAALANNKADVALVGPEQLFYRNAGGKEALVAIASLGHIDDALILARDAGGDFNREALRGKSLICPPPNSTTGIVLEGFLRRQGLAPDQHLNIFNNVPGSLMIGAFLAGSGSFILLPEPEASILESGGGGTVVGFPGALAGEIPSALCVVRKDSAPAGESLQKFLNGVYKAQLWLQHHPLEEIQTLAGGYFNWDKELLQRSVRRYYRLGIWSEQPAIAGAAFDNFQDLMESAGELPAPVKYEEAVNNSFAEEAKLTVIYPPPEEEQES